MKVMFVSYINVQGKADFGGAQASIRNYHGLLRNNTVDCYTIEKKSTIKSIVSILQLRMSPIRIKDENNIINLIKEESYDCVWLDSSLMGSLVRKIKKQFSNVVVCSFYHNIESDYVKVRIGNIFKQLIYGIVAKKEEKMTTAYSDRRILLSERDANRLRQMYGDCKYDVLPITFADIFDEEKIKSDSGLNIKKGLFVGAYGRSNYEGLVWFLKNVHLPDNVVIQVIGKDFEKHKGDIVAVNPFINVNVIGTVDNLEDYYYDADFVILPILFGAGMKVKTAEALMYGKSIFGTSEAFAGYQMDYDRVGCCADDINELNEKITHYLNDGATKYNAYSREVFLNKYSSKVSDDYFAHIK